MWYLLGITLPQHGGPSFATSFSRTPSISRDVIKRCFIKLRRPPVSQERQSSKWDHCQSIARKKITLDVSTLPFADALLPRKYLERRFVLLF